MEIVKTPSNQAPPYDPQSNYTISWDIDPAVYDFSSGYVLLPMALTETQTAVSRGGSYANAVNNVSLGSSSGQVNLATMNVRSVRLTVDGQDVYYCPRVNQLIASLGTFAYNLPEERLEEYFSGNNQTYPAGLEAGSALNYSVFRELLNEGDILSSKFNASLRIPISRLLDGFTDQIKDLKKYMGITLTIELDDVTAYGSQSLSVLEPNPPFGSDVRISGATNTMQWGVAIAGTVTGTNTFTTTLDFTQAAFPFAVGDSINFTTSGNAKAILGVAVAANKIVLTFAGASMTNGADSILANSVGTFKQYMLTGQTSTALANATFPAGTSVAVYNNTNSFTVYGTETVAFFYSGGNVNVLLSVASPISITGNYLATGPLFLQFAGTPGNGVSIGADLPTVDDFSTATFPLWVGCPVLVTSPTAALTTMSTIISAIDYNAGKARLTFTPAITASSGGAIAANTVAVVPQKAASVAISYPEVLQHVQYRLNAMTSAGIQTSPMYRRWVYDADTMPQLPASGTYEKTFILEPGCDFAVIALCPQGGLTSNVGGLLSYRLRLDGIDTTSRDILLSGDQSYRFERLLNGYMYLTEDLDAISTDQTVNPMVLDSGTYVILQDLIVDGKQHQLTVSLRNGSAGVFTQRNVGLYKRVISQLM
jgi:hypothetical protein